MNEEIYILIIEDEAEVLDALVRDLEPMEERFPIEMASSAEEARTLIVQMEEEGHAIGLLLCDHLLPGENGVELLIDLQTREWTQKSRKVLVTGQAGLEDTVKAVNRAQLNYYIAKPWKQQELLQIVKDQLTEYVIDSNWEVLPFMKWLNQERIAEYIRDKGSVSDN